MLICALLTFQCIRVFFDNLPIKSLITYRAKLLNADWLRRRAFFLNHQGTFGNQEGMIT